MKTRLLRKIRKRFFVWHTKDGITVKRRNIYLLEMLFILPMSMSNKVENFRSIKSAVSTMTFYLGYNYLIHERWEKRTIRKALKSKSL